MITILHPKKCIACDVYYTPKQLAQKYCSTLEKGVICRTNASIDRLEAGGPYIKDNIQLVCSVLNKFRINTPVAEFVWWCKKVAEHNAN